MTFLLSGADGPQFHIFQFIIFDLLNQAIKNVCAQDSVGCYR